MTAAADPASLKYWLALVRAPGIGARRCRQLLDTCDDPAALFVPETLHRLAEGLPEQALTWLREPDWSLIEADLEWLRQADAHILTLADPGYPPLLAGIADPPPVLFLRGDPALLREPQLAIVGSRNPTSGGERNAREFARHLASTGFVIDSGLALGIDAAAHRGALAAGAPTLAVMGSGPDRIYPASHRELATGILERGVLVTEFPPGTRVVPANFPRRNRIISGLSVGTLVVEAAPRSGSLITARLALEQGREVFAIPGSIHSPLSRGCHALIRAGATLVETADDILRQVGSLTRQVMEQTDPGAAPEQAVVADEVADEDYHTLLRELGHDPLGIDALVAATGLTANVVSSMLLLLELRGEVVSQPGGTYTRA